MPAAPSKRVSELYAVHRDDLVRYLIHMLGCRALAEEFVQDVFAIVLKRGEPQFAELNWGVLQKIASNLALDYIRHRKREVNAHRVLAGCGEPAAADEKLQPEQRALAEDASRHLIHTVQRLRPKQRQAFVMRYVKQMDRQDIADQLGISCSALNQRLIAAVALCKIRLKALGLDSSMLG